MSVKYSLPSVAMYVLSYDTPGLFLPHSNTLETLKLGTGVYSGLSIYVEQSLSTSAE